MISPDARPERAISTSLRERALAALATKRQLEAEAEADRERREREREAQQFAKYLLDFQAELDRRGFAGVVATDRRIEVEGVTLELRYWRESNGIVALAPCRNCGFDNADYAHVRHLADFGYVLAEWLTETANYQCGRCEERGYWQSVERERAEEATAEQEDVATEATPELPPRCLEARLGDLLRELIRSEIER